MCADGVDLGRACRLCGRPLLSCWDDGPGVSWHASAADAVECAARVTPGNRAGAATSDASQDVKQ